MKKAVILFSAFLLFSFVAGCKSAEQNAPESPDAAAAPAPDEYSVPSPNLIAFGLTMKWKAVYIKLDDAWATKYSYYEKKYFPKWGMEVKEVLLGTQAAQAGFKPGDIIFMVNDDVFANTSKFVRLMCSSEPGKEMNIRVVRDVNGSKELVDLTMMIPTDSISSGSFPILFGYSKNDYQKKWHYGFLAILYSRSTISTHAWGIWPLYVPIYHRERVGSVVTQRVLWFFKWRVGPEDDITF